MRIRVDLYDFIYNKKGEQERFLSEVIRRLLQYKADDKLFACGHMDIEVNFTRV